MNYKILIIIILTLISQIIYFIIGYNKGVKQTHREAYENGLMIMSRDNGKNVLRWIETHKIGYDYE